ncbi:signal peptidase I [Quadrisphaera oryzae]|uniref:signal peptidase I n=1 Tax=Quadrisphaera TaxID=317661 RepID=UPI0016468AE6|nr:signal peptidase I [Quadrisphaera sp. RL12-1S]
MVDQQARHESPPPDGPGRRSRERGPLAGLLAALREAVVVVVAALVLSLLVKTFLVQAFYIPSESMEDTLLVGDRVLVSQLTPGPVALQRGDVVVFEDPGGWLQPQPEPDRGPVGNAVVDVLTFVGVLPSNSGQHLIKRVIGLPGDHVVCCDAQGLTTVNGVAIHEDFLKPGSVSSEKSFDVTVPPNSLWVEGDNRQNSGDSRYHPGSPGGGAVPVDDVVGRAVVIVWPLDRLTWLGRHAEAFAGVPAASSGG